MSKYKRYERYKDSGVEWIGEIPEHWEIKKLKYICSESAVYGLNESAENYAEEGVRFIRTTDIDDKGNLDSNEEGVFLPEEKTKGYILKTGDLLVSRSGSLGTSLYFDENKYGKCSYAGYLVKFRANSKNHPKFLFYFSKSNIFYIQIQMALVSSTISNFNGNKYANMILTLSSYNEQKTIANFLDQKTAEIDDLIADKEKLIELLQEKRQAIITEAVTKGLNPNVKMKDSGIEWIGEIPEHWNVEPIKYMVKTIQTGTTPTTKNDDYFDGDIQWFTPGDFHGSKELYEASRKISNLAVIDNEARLFPKNTVMIVGIGATVGKVAKLGVEGSFNQQITGLIVNEQRLNCDYLYYWLYINQETIKNISNYTTLPIINNEFVKNFECLSLPLDEQQAIVNYLNQKTSEIDDLILKIKLQIQKLKEYRQSLIFEAVTGKIDVRDYVVD